VAPVLTYPDGSIQHAGMAMATAPGAPGFTVPLHEGKGLPASTLPIHPFDVDLLSGAVLMVPTALYEEVGGMPVWLGKGDFEDVALCRLLSQHGTLRVVPGVQWTHVEGASYQRYGQSAVLVTLAKSVLFEQGLAAWRLEGSHG
jgi:GT2 family glycosyltransferase